MKNKNFFYIVIYLDLRLNAYRLFSKIIFEKMSQYKNGYN